MDRGGGCHQRFSAAGRKLGVKCPGVSCFESYLCYQVARAEGQGQGGNPDRLVIVVKRRQTGGRDWGVGRDGQGAL